ERWPAYFRPVSHRAQRLDPLAAPGRPVRAGRYGTERIRWTNSEPSTVMTATDRYSDRYPPSWLTRGAATAGASTCGPVLATLMMPRSLARPAAVGSTWVTRAASTDRYTP